MATKRREPFPKHGTSARRSNFRCKCVACVRRMGAVDDEYEVRWTLNPLLRMFGTERLTDWFGTERMAQWEATGLADMEADKVAITLGSMPWEVWGGWLEAGLDKREEQDIASRVE